MTSLLADGWFYLSAGGLVISAVLFVVLLGQYRAAVEAEDDEEEPEMPAPVPVKTTGERVYTPKVVADPIAPLPKPVDIGVKTSPDAAKSGGLPSAEKTVVESPTPVATFTPKPIVEAPPSAAVPTAAAAPAAKAPEAKTMPPSDKRRDTTTGAISPAVVYLQNIKMQMERLDKDIVNLKSLASQQATQGETILSALGALAERVEQLAAKAAESAAVASKAVELAALAGKATPNAGQHGGHPSAGLPSVYAAPVEASPEATLQAEVLAGLEIRQITEPEPAAAAQEPAAEPPAAEQPSPDDTQPAVAAAEPAVVELKIEPPPEPAAPPQPEPAAEAQPKAARKGPVWPI